MEKIVGKYLFRKFNKRNILKMNRRNILLRITRKIRKIVGFPPKYQESDKARKHAARIAGRQFKLKKNNYIFHCEELKPLFYLPLYRTDYIQQRIITEKCYYENANLNYICHKWGGGRIGNDIENKCVLDIGANIGNHTLFFFFECKIKKAYCFEPVTSTFNILSKNIILNGLSDKVELINAAVGAEKSTASIVHYDETNIGSTQIALGGNGKIPVVSIDSLTFDDDIKLIKIDVEGFELFVLNGCLQTIAKYKPYIMVEIQEANFKTVESLLSQHGYRHIHLDNLNYLFFI